MGRTKPEAGAKIRLPGQGAQPPSLILCEILKVCSATAECVRFTQKADIAGHDRHVRFVPKADIALPALRLHSTVGIVLV